ncbi:hypothetical protein V6N12_023118 [Hibiscus sabdariffa]|uniref:DUF4378 domain-containing protein n=1 Tax=Hibiscus sabdariffa TaxID=183260 RepID=A0ABR2FWS4_9ROSI
MRGNRSNMSIPQGHQHNPSCMWGIFHVLKYHHWNRRFIKKRVSNKKQDSGDEKSKDEPVGASKTSADDSSKHNKAEAANSKVEGKKKAPGTGSKGSVTSRLKALITEEVSKVTGRDSNRGSHHRSSTYPIPSKSDPDNQVDDLPDMEQSQGSTRPDDKNKGICNESGTEDEDVPKSSEESVTDDENDEECSSEKGSSKEKADENKKTLLESAILSEEELERKKKALQDYSKDKDGPGYESKYLMDALDIIKMNQGFLLTVLQDPDSPLAQHFQKQLAMSAKMGMPQSTGSTSRESQSPDGDSEAAEDFCRKSTPSIAADRRADGIHSLNQAKAQMADMSASSSHNLNPSEMARNRFKSLKENLRHVIQERKKERHRIAMDAVLHKIPHQKGFSKDLTPDIVDHVKDPTRTKKLSSSSLARRGSLRLERRTSFNESIDKYAQLYEYSFTKETKEESISKSIQERREEPIDSRPKSTKKCMRRILSSPDLYSSAYSFTSDIPTNVEHSPHGRKFKESEALDYSSERDNVKKNESEDNSAFIREALPVSSDHLSSTSSVNSKPISQVAKITSDNISQSEQDSKPEIISEGPTGSSAESSKVQETDIEPTQSFELPNAELDFLPDLQQELKNTLKVAGGGIIDLEQLKGLQKDLDTIDKQEFAYVKDVLELSGFSKNEALGAWHADNQPLDPMMYEEIGGCVICDQNCPKGGEEVGYCNHPLLFDLVNEVLVDVYERSYSYYPKVLSPLCHVRPMPVGCHVLEQVWERISWYLSYKTGYDKPLDYVASRDLMVNDGWMNLQFEHESLALEVEELIFNEILEDFLPQ